MGVQEPGNETTVYIPECNLVPRLSCTGVQEPGNETTEYIPECSHSSKQKSKQ